MNRRGDFRAVMRKSHSPAGALYAPRGRPAYAALHEAGIRAVWREGLRGRREAKKDSVNTGWKEESFRGYADYMETKAFDSEVDWLMRLAVRTCYDFLRSHQRNRESAFSDLSEPEDDWLERFIHQPGAAREDSDAARQLVQRVLQHLSPPARLVITLLEIEDRSVKEISKLTGWSVPLVKV